MKVKELLNLIEMTVENTIRRELKNHTQQIKEIISEGNYQKNNVNLTVAKNTVSPGKSNIKNPVAKDNPMYLLFEELIPEMVGKTGDGNINIEDSMNVNTSSILDVINSDNPVGEYLNKLTGNNK
jgi:hypothetical protein